jgi:hypothetical protein
MKINLSDFISWQTCIILLLLLIFFLWLGYGGEENVEYVGLSPLQTGIDAKEHLGLQSKKKEEENSDEIEEKDSDEIEENSDEIEEEGTNFINSFDLEKVPLFAIPTLENTERNICFSESYDSYIDFEEDEVPKSPRSLALGNYTCHKSGKISKGEALCKKIIEEIYGVPFYCVRPNFLKNPETGRNLELDMYNDHLKIGIEYNSDQHYVFPNSFHKTHEEFINQVRRDQFKLDTCDKNGIYLITVPHNIPVKYDSIKEYIVKHLPENYKKND